MPKGHKICPKCNAAVGCRRKVCPECKHEFQPEVPAPANRASDILPDPPPPQSGPPPLPGPSGPPAEIPTDPDANPCGESCITHPEYKAEKPPRIACEGCWRAYLKEKFGERIRPLDPAHIVKISDDSELVRFINDLQKARNHSKHSGGCYSAFLHGKEITLQIDVHLNWKKE